MNDSAWPRIANFVIAASVLAAPLASATSMLEPHREKVLISYANGDTLTTECPIEVGSCAVVAKVNGKRFRFSAGEVGANILPFDATLFSGEFSGRDKYFSLVLSVECPDDLERVCEANLLLEHGKAAVVSINHVR